MSQEEIERLEDILEQLAGTGDPMYQLYKDKLFEARIVQQRRKEKEEEEKRRLKEREERRAAALYTCDPSKIPLVLDLLAEVPRTQIVPDSLFPVLNAAYDKATTTAAEKEAIEELIQELGYPSEERMASQIKRNRNKLEEPVFTDGALGKRKR